jgi:choline dehydrogenase-like flavoprotein
MPTIIRGHTNASSILIGAKAADLISASAHPTNTTKTASWPKTR